MYNGQSNSPVTNLHCYLFKASGTLDTFSEGPSLKSFDCHVPEVAAQYSKWFVSHSLILSLSVHGENEIGGLGLKNRLLSTCILIALSPFVAGDIPIVQGKDCMLTFLYQFQHYPCYLKGLQNYTTIWENYKFAFLHSFCAVLCTGWNHGDFFPEHCGTYTNVEGWPIQSQPIYICPRPAGSYVDSSVYQINTLDWRSMGQVDNQCSSSRIFTSEVVPWVIRRLFSWPMWKTGSDSISQAHLCPIPCPSIYIYHWACNQRL